MKLRSDYIDIFVKFAEEIIKGGLADEKTPEPNKNALKEGVEVEMEHTKNPEVAKEIARDHIQEDKKYYKKLKIMESPEFAKAFKKASDR